MVSLRRRRLLGLSTGPSPILDPLFWYADKKSSQENPTHEAKPVIMQHAPSSNVEEPTEDTNVKVAIRPADGLGSGASKDSHDRHFSGLGQEIKRRKRHRRKVFENQEPCVMRGVYFKNLKWQAAIKVDKKQIHLGTVSTQEAAAHLYDRAAFMCGREPNFELSKQEKEELTGYNWDEFLTITRSSITNKKHRRRIGVSSKKRADPSQQSSDLEGEQETNSFSASDGAQV